MPTTSAVRTALSVVAAFWLAGCASAPVKLSHSPTDPYERLNRGTYRVNDGLDKAILRPVAKGYKNYTPQPLQTGISNFVANMEMPGTLVNDILQGKLRAAVSDTGRLLLNTTMGIGGMFDVASKAGIDHNDEDFGQTLGKWGVPAGPYVVIPILGPSDMRDAPSRVVDIFTNPAHYANTAASWSYTVVSNVNKRADLLSLDATVDKAFDPYVFLRDAYFKNRAYKVADGNVPDEELVDPEADTQSGAPSSPPPKR
jgi:phospholipid-binding lipoprotein MlaA